MKKILYPAAVLLLAAVITLCKYTPEALENGNTSKKVEAAPGLTAGIVKEGLSPNSYADVFIVSVTDGDTIKVQYKGKVYKVRLLDIDTPETVKQGVRVQAYGKEATRYIAKLVLNKRVRLVFEKGLKDRYGRILAYVFLKDGSFINAMLVRNGYARVEIVPPNIRLSKYFNQLQEEAIADKSGLWRLPENKRPFIKDAEGEYVPDIK